MDLVSLSFSVCVMVVYLPGAARFSSSNNSCPCPEIPQWSLTKPPPQTCFQIGNQFRYQCIDGYSRRAGTSTLIKCKLTGGVPQWTKPNLECISNPKIATTQSAATKVKAAAPSTNEMQHLSTLPSVPQERDTTETTTCATSTTQMMPNENAFPSVLREMGTTETNTHESVKATTVATMSAVFQVAACCLGIVFLLYLRRSEKNIPVQTADEVRPMNPDPSGVDL